MTRITATVEVLHLIEDEHAMGRTTSVTTLRDLSDLSETTLRKAVKELEAGGFIHEEPHDARDKARCFSPVSKNDQAAEEVKNMTDTSPENPGPGRPRATDTLARDEATLKLLTENPSGLTVAELATALDVKTGIAYLSVWRLRKDGKVAKTATGDRTPRWAKA